MKKIMFILLISLISIVLFCDYGFAQGDDSANVDSDFSANYEQTFEGTEQKRNLPNVNMAPFPNSPTYFAKPKETFEGMPIPDLVRLHSKWDLIDVKSWLDGREGDVDLRIHEVYTRDWDEDELKELKVTFKKPQNYTFLGVLVAKADNDVPMETVFGRILDKALEIGGNVVYPINQGASRVLAANAWGASLGYTHVAISQGSQSNAGGGSIGVGYTHGEVKYNHEPFLRVMVAHVDQETFENLQIFNGQNNLKKQNEILRKKLRILQQQIQAN